MATRKEGDRSTWLVAVYKVFIGLMAASFVGVGIAAFYVGPRMPDALMYLNGPVPPELQAAASAYRDAETLYNRNVAVIAAIGAILVLVLSLTVLRKIALFSDGLLLGGVLTFGYSVVRGFAAEDNMVRFVTVAVGLAVALVLGYVRFVRRAVEPVALEQVDTGPRQHDRAA